MRRARPLLCLGLLIGSCATGNPPRNADPAVSTRRAPAVSRTVDERIAEAREKLERHPRLDPVWAELGEAFLDRARATRDPEDVRFAREAFERSLALQENFVALRGMTALANFRHRFEEAIRWSIEAEKAYPEDTSVRAMRVEALLTLDRLGEAEQELAGWALTAEEFHLRAATARVLLAKGRRSDAVDLYLQAARIAEGSAPGLAQWSLVRAAAAYIDSGAPDRARPILERALDLGAASLDAQVHMAEVEEAGEDPHRALARLEVLLRDTADPTVAAAAARLARKLGDAKSAERHFRAAETVFRKALTAGEQYTLGALARLQLDADADLDEALELARRNAQVQPTPEARELERSIETARAARAGASGR